MNTIKVNIEPVKHICELQRGDVVRHVVTGETYVVLVNYGSHATAVDSVDIMNPAEWVIIKKPLC